jgi:DNA polymerase (family X)
MVEKFEIVRALRDIAALLELKKTEPYRVRAYRRGADSLELTEQNFSQLCEENKLDEIPGIGPKIASIIYELYRTNQCHFLEELKKDMPVTSLDLVGIPGLDFKRLQLLQQLGIQTRDELLQACQNGMLASRKGLGKTLEKKFLVSLIADANGPKIILSKALTLSELLLKYMKQVSLAAEISGEVRRRLEVISNIQIVVAAEDFAQTRKHFEHFSSFVKTEWQSASTGVAYLSNKMPVYITITTQEQFIEQLHNSTGSPAHLSRLQQIAQTKVDPFLPKKLKHNIAWRDSQNGENRIYNQLGLPYIPPELREDWGEIEEAQMADDFSDLIRLEDIKGMIHCHSTYSDGNATIYEMAKAAEDMGYSYITITDHSPNAFYANGLDVERLKRQWEEIEEVQEKLKIKILRGTESDILASGALDYPDSILEQFDVIIASIHARYKMDEDKMTQRIQTCMHLPLFKIWGHAVGRILLKREPVPCRMEELLDTVATSSAAIEVNGDPHRMDMEPFWLREARKRNIKFVISTDAHATSDLYNLPFGISSARRGGLRKKDVLNVLSHSQFKKAVSPAAPKLSTL